MQVNPNQSPQNIQQAVSQAASAAAQAAGKIDHDQMIQNLKDLAKAKKMEDHAPEGRIVDKMKDFAARGAAVAAMKAFDGATHLMNETLDIARGKTPKAQQKALEFFYNRIAQMTPGELDDVKDTIVKRMGSHDSSQWERDILQKMYQIADAVAENRTPPYVGKPNKILPFIAPPFPPSKPPLEPIVPHPFKPAPALKEPWVHPFPKDIQLEKQQAEEVKKTQSD